MRDGFAVVWLVGVGVASLLPALLHGVYLGPFDLLRTQGGLTRQIGVIAHNSSTGDRVNAIIPWTVLDWTQVHHGQWPLWNPYNGLGLPLAFNWQSAPFSLNALVGYLFPLHFAYDAGCFVTLVTAGTGAYVLCRTLRITILGCVLAGTVFELSGPMNAWLGYPHGAVASWAGWLFAACLLIIRGRRRARDVALFAVVLAMAIYAGQPEVLTFLILSVIVFAVVLLGRQAIALRSLRSAARPAVDLAMAGAAGLALGSPLLLPGFQVISKSVRSGAFANVAVPAHGLMWIVSQGFNGLPLAGNGVFGGNIKDYSIYVGATVVVLALTAVILRWRLPVISAFALIALLVAAMEYVPIVDTWLRSVPVLDTMDFRRPLLYLAFALAILAGVGMDLLVRHSSNRAVLRWAAAGFAAVGVVLVVVFLMSRGTLLRRVDINIRAKSFIWPAVEAVVGLLVCSCLYWIARRDGREEPLAIQSTVTPAEELTIIGDPAPTRMNIGWWAGAVLLVCETAFLISAGAPIYSSSSSFYASTPAVTALQRAVGSSRVGLGRAPFGQLGIRPEANDAYGVDELSAYDPVVPAEYFTSWKDFAHGGSPLRLPVGKFDPYVTSATQARLVGVSYVLVKHAAHGPIGGRFDRRIGNEDLYRIPNSGLATLSALTPDGGLPPTATEGKPIAVSDPNPSIWTMRTSSSVPQVLRLRLTNLPGWHASIDGNPLALEPFAGMMLQARIPAGDHVVELHYWPDTFNAGLVLASVAAVVLLLAIIVEEVLRGRNLRPAGRVTEGRAAETEDGTATNDLA